MTTVIEPAPAAQAPPPGSSALQRLMKLEITPRKVPRKDLMHFSRQMAVFLRAGIPLVDALQTVEEEAGNKTFKIILADMIASLQGGATFASAAAQHNQAFPEYYIGILRSAELTGNLDVVLDQLAEYIERDLDARRRVTQALTYPAVIAVVAIVVVTILMVVVLPKFTKFFADLHAKLPLPTRMLIGASNLASNYWFVWLGLLGLFAVVLIWMSQATKGRVLRDRILLRIPVVGDLVRHSVLERFCRILSSMMTAGVPLPEAMAVTAEATSNSVYRKAITEVRLAMMRGEGLAAPLAATGLFPAAARQMFRVGESTGSLDLQLRNASIYFDRELDHKVKRFTSLFEPTVIVMMGVIVGFVAIALVSAMYGMVHSASVQ
ncbi:MAG: type pilus assembly protein PilC [Frankiales bacterium]|nr:type pilus assembly protein PilC [Frankiales bacterium]MDX6275640.1 type pilus assembly protein PilC [Frankiales bacterium]